MNASRTYKDYYAILGISKNASQKEIKDAYRKLARKYHPDANNSNKETEEKFKEINEAYEVLKDPEKRKQYDAMGSYFSGKGFGGFNPQDFAGFDGAGFSNFKGGFSFNGLGDLFDIFNFDINGRAAGTRAFKGEDIIYNIHLTFDEALKGKTVQFVVNRGGSQATETVKIPPGVADGSKLKFKGKGGAGKNGGPAGDLYVVTKVAAHPFFKQKGSDILLDVPVTFTEAALGASIEIPTIDGSVALKIPAGTHDGQTFRLRGKGAPKLKGAGRGDMLATVRIEVPKDITPEQKELLLKFASSRKDDPRRIFKR
ncbi:MAG: DnaJ domain-containing protein [Firmicutes bacterium]|nr:DnaJ domain-containing protein [Bacillota bacterium]